MILNKRALIESLTLKDFYLCTMFANNLFKIIVISIFVFKNGSGFSQFIPHYSEAIMIAIDSNKHYKNETTGFRLLLKMDNNKVSLDSLEMDFSRDYPKTETHIVFEAPNFLLTAGDFRTEIEAQFFLLGILPKYSGARVINSKIKLPRID